MADVDKKITPEQVAKIDFALKAKGKSGALLAIDRLFFEDREPGLVERLKIAGQELTAAKDLMDGELQELWQGMLGRQLRVAVNRAKKTVTDGKDRGA